jgi:hypothetical protein
MVSHGGSNAIKSVNIWFDPRDREANAPVAFQGSNNRGTGFGGGHDQCFVEAGSSENGKRSPQYGPTTHVCQWAGGYFSLR